MNFQSSSKPDQSAPRAAELLWGGWPGGFLSAVVLVFCFPVFHQFILWPLAWVALIPLLLYLSRGGCRRGLIQVGVFGFPFMVGVLAWVYYMGIAPWLLLAATQAGYVGLFTLTAAIIAPLWRPGLGVRSERPRPWRVHVAAVTLFPCAWIFMEWTRTLGRLSIPWGFLSSTQIHLHPLVETARWWGAYGVSFMIVMINSAIANWILSTGRDRGRAAWTFGAAAVIVVAASILAVVTFQPRPVRPLKAALIQGDIYKDNPSNPAYREHVMGTYTDMSRTAAEHQPNVIVWPETVVPGSFLHDPELRQEVIDVALQTHSYLLVGSPDYPNLYNPWQTPRYNTAFVISPEGVILGRYDKQHLVPYGEYVPGRSWLPFLNLYGVPETDLDPGHGHGSISTPLGRWGIMICYESMFPQIARQTVQSGANVLFVITNDQWFGTSSAPYDHAADAAFRAAETGRWVVQAASTGVSLFADPSGRLTRQTRMFTRGIDVREVSEQTGTTLYTRLGDWPPILSLPILVFAFILSLVTKIYRPNIGTARREV
ncbi:MAG TPA: apolipoprotein N-acyltransferase [Armatimonadota bacterium]|nr:apolipoprotein N-acyltransferase [Armatimonadota bacterium]